MKYFTALFAGVIGLAACSGSEGRAFPYGDSYDAAACNSRSSTAIATGAPTGTAAVGSFSACQGGLPGLYDMAGNVAEWVEGRFAARGKNTKHVSRAVCGGSFKDPVTRSMCASRRGYPDGGKSPCVGFRCARDK